MHGNIVKHLHKQTFENHYQKHNLYLQEESGKQHRFQGPFATKFEGSNHQGIIICSLKQEENQLMVKNTLKCSLKRVARSIIRCTQSESIFYC